MSDPKHITPESARRRVQESDTLSVCAYDDEDECRSELLDGAITLQDLQARLPKLRKYRNLVFYCA